MPRPWEWQLICWLFRMKHPVIKGHPLHAILSDIPIGALIATAVVDAIWLGHPSPMWLRAAELTLLVTLAGAVLAALAGLWDWFGIPRGHAAKTRAAYHGWTNVAAVALLLASLAVHWRMGNALGPILTFCGLAVASVAGWLGGDLVFRLGWRVTPAEHAEMLEEALRKDGQVERIRTIHEAVREFERKQTLLP